MPFTVPIFTVIFTNPRGVKFKEIYFKHRYRSKTKRLLFVR